MTKGLRCDTNFMITRFIPILIAGLILIVSPANAQTLSVADRFGVQVDFPDGWQKLSQHLYSIRMQRQLFTSQDSVFFVWLQRFPLLNQTDKETWHEGPTHSHPFRTADKITKLKPSEWPIAIDIASNDILSKTKSGACIYLVEREKDFTYVVFLARSDTFVRFLIGADRPFDQSIAEEMQALWRRVQVAPDLLPLEEDPYTVAHNAFHVERDFEKSKFLFEQVPTNHERYWDAQRILAISIYGNHLNQWEQAVPLIEEAYRLNPSETDVLEDIGAIYLKTGRVDQGIAYLTEAGTPKARRLIAKFEESQD